MAKFTLDLQYVVEEVAECLSRNSVLVPVLSLPRSIQVASVNVLLGQVMGVSGSLL